MIDWKNISFENLAGYISEQLRQEGIETVLVGGACVTIYSKNRYQSYDLDFVTYEDVKKVRNVLINLGFKEKSGCFRHEDCPWFVEFVSPPVAIGNEPVEKLNTLETPLGMIKMLSPTDSVKDRLSAYYHWDDTQTLDQAVQICQEQAVDIKDVERWSEREEMSEKLQVFLSRLS